MNADNVAEIFGMFSSSTRIGIFNTLLKGESNVGNLASEVGVSLSGVSQHLAKLSLSGYVEKERRAQAIYYTIAPSKSELIGKVMGLAETL